MSGVYRHSEETRAKMSQAAKDRWLVGTAGTYVRESDQEIAYRIEATLFEMVLSGGLAPEALRRVHFAVGDGEWTWAPPRNVRCDGCGRPFASYHAMRIHAVKWCRLSA